MGKNEKSAQTGSMIITAVAMVAGVLIGLMFGQHERPIRSSSLQDKVGEVMKLVDEQYVDQMDADSLSERLIASMMSELDPHSAYFSVRETERKREKLMGSFDGVGLMLQREGDTTYVGQVIADGPSVGLGIMPGDKILHIDGKDIYDPALPSDTLVAMLRGHRGSKVRVRVERKGAPMPLDFAITRGVVPRHTVLHHTMIDDTTGYVLLESFAATSAAEFRNALRELKVRGMRHLIFDLRGNGGGALQSAVEIAEELLPKGSLIVYTKGAHSRRRNVYAHGNGLFADGRVTVMVDENSASASEVVSGALQDNDRATIVGRRTFGKGLVQTDYMLRDGSSLLLTTARYYTPSGRCIQRPYGNGTDEYYRDYLNQLIEETYADSVDIHIADTTPYYTVGGRVVYGGGGIIPDRVLLVQHDETFVYYNQLRNRGLFVREAFDYVRNHATELAKKYGDAKAFGKGFEVSDRMLNSLIARAEKEGVKSDARAIAKQRQLMRAMLKALVGQAMFGDEAFYDAVLPEDHDLKAVMHGENQER